MELRQKKYNKFNIKLKKKTTTTTTNKERNNKQTEKNYNLLTELGL